MSQGVPCDVPPPIGGPVLKPVNIPSGMTARDAVIFSACALVDEHDEIEASGNWPRGGYTPAYSALRVSIADYRAKSKVSK